MNLTIYTGPDPYAALDELFRRTPMARPVLAIVPDRLSILPMQRRLAALAGGAYSGHRVYTLDMTAFEVLRVSGMPVGPVEDHVRRALVAEVVRLQVGEGSRYHEVSRLGGFVSLAASWLSEMRSMEPPDAVIHPEPELSRIARSYGHELARMGRTDQEGAIARACEPGRMEVFSDVINGPVVVDGFYDLTRNQERFLMRLFEVFTRGAMTLVHDPERPGLFELPDRLMYHFRSAGARVVTVPPADSGDAAEIRRMFQGADGPADVTGDGISIHMFRSADAEAGWVAGTVRSLIGTGTPPGDIMVVARSRPAWGSPLYREFRRHGIPVDGPAGRPLLFHPVVRLVIDALDAAVDPSDETLFTRVQRSWYTTPGGDGLLTRADDDDRVWSCMIAESDTPEGYVRSLRDMIGRLGVRARIAACPDAGPDMDALDRFDELLDGFSGFHARFHPRMRKAEFTRLLRRYLEDVPVPSGTGPMCGVSVVGIDQARHIRRDVVFLTGLDNTAFPGRYDSYSLHDHRRAAALRADREREDPLLFYMAMAGASRLYLTFPGLDDEGGDAAMSPYLRGIVEALDGQVAPLRHVRVPGSSWEGGAVNARGRVEGLIRLMKGDPGTAEPLLGAVMRRDMTLHGKTVEAVKGYIERERTTGLDLTGRAALEGHAGDWGPDRVFPVTGLEDYNTCPVLFFLARILGLADETLVEGELDPAGRGTLVHEILADFYRERRARTGSGRFAAADMDECRGSMRGLAERAFTSRLLSRRKLHPVVALTERGLVMDMLEEFLRNEADYFEQTGFDPSFFEVAFGRPGGPQGEYPPLDAGTGGDPVLVGGKIDRIDVDGTGAVPLVRVLDYKTGTAVASLAELEKGRSLQPPLYLKAAAGLILQDGMLYDGVYYALRDMQLKVFRRNRNPVLGDDWRELIETACAKASEAAAGIRTGRFPADRDACTGMCRFSRLCMSARFDGGGDGDAA